MSNIKAQWYIALNCDCPECLEDIDLLCTDGWEWDGLQVAEHDTKASTNYEVECPNCGHEFLVDFEY